MNTQTNTNAGATKVPVIVAAIVPVNELVTRFEFVRQDKTDFPAFSGGAHTVVEMHDSDESHLNPYSLMSDPTDLSRYAISVRRDDEGRGGSLFMHQKVKIGDEMLLSFPVNLFPLDLRAKKHLFIAGGIGITPFIAMIAQLNNNSGNWGLHYSARTAELASYADILQQNNANKVKLYLNSLDQHIPLQELLNGQSLGTHVYVCGPKGMISWVRETAEQAGYPAENIHYEEFLAPQPGLPFTVSLKKSGLEIEVDENQSLLEAIESAGVSAPYLCRGGACGQCETNVLAYDGEFDHRDHWLEDDERHSGKKIMPCVSRFIGNKLVINR